MLLVKMKFLKRVWVNVPDQVLSTAVIFLLAYIPIRGIIAIIKDPPEILTILIVMGAGIALGILASIPTEDQIKKWKDENIINDKKSDD